jgi:hypothetical protein
MRLAMHAFNTFLKLVVAVLLVLLCACPASQPSAPEQNDLSSVGSKTAASKTTAPEPVVPKSAGPANRPAWLNARIDELLKETSRAPSGGIWKYEVEGKMVYYFVAPCCDQFNTLFDAEGRYLCAPDGGFTGRGDEKCLPAHLVQTKKQLVWEDPRTAKAAPSRK